MDASGSKKKQDPSKKEEKVKDQKQKVISWETGDEACKKQMKKLHKEMQKRAGRRPGRERKEDASVMEKPLLKKWMDANSRKDKLGKIKPNSRKVRQLLEISRSKLLLVEMGEGERLVPTYWVESERTKPEILVGVEIDLCAVKTSMKAHSVLLKESKPTRGVACKLEIDGGSSGSATKVYEMSAGPFRLNLGLELDDLITMADNDSAFFNTLCGGNVDVVDQHLKSGFEKGQKDKEKKKESEGVVLVPTLSVDKEKLKCDLNVCIPLLRLGKVMESIRSVIGLGGQEIESNSAVYNKTVKIKNSGEEKIHDEKKQIGKSVPPVIANIEYLLTEYLKMKSGKDKWLVKTNPLHVIGMLGRNLRGIVIDHLKTWKKWDVRGKASHGKLDDRVNSIRSSLMIMKEDFTDMETVIMWWELIQGARDNKAQGLDLYKDTDTMEGWLSKYCLGHRRADVMLIPMIGADGLPMVVVEYRQLKYNDAIKLWRVLKTLSA